MKIKMTKTVEVRVTPKSRRIYEAGKTYTVNEADLALDGRSILEHLVADDGAEGVAPTTVAELRPDQVAVLASAADSIIVQAQTEAVEALRSADLDGMKVAELKQLAAVCGVALDPAAKKADIVATLEAARSTLDGASDAQSASAPGTEAH